VLALPSITEGFGLPVLEAMQSGCPVVASTGGALPETAGGAALLVDPLDTQGWVAALSQVLDDPALRQDLRARGLARARQFTWAKTAAATLGLYRGA
jgi:glycosyltransferase involved in cell wall biosynthesis